MNIHFLAPPPHFYLSRFLPIRNAFFVFYVYVKYRFFTYLRVCAQKAYVVSVYFFFFFGTMGERTKGTGKMPNTYTSWSERRDVDTEEGVESDEIGATKVLGAGRQRRGVGGGGETLSAPKNGLEGTDGPGAVWGTLWESGRRR